MSQEDKKDQKPVDMQELVRKYDTDRSTLSPEVRAKVEAADAIIAERRAQGGWVTPASCSTVLTLTVGSRSKRVLR